MLKNILLMGIFLSFNFGESANIFAQAETVVCSINAELKAITKFSYSPDKKHIAYSVDDGYKCFIMFDDKVGKKYDRLGAITFSPDSKQLAYFARENDDIFLVLNDIEGEKQKKVEYMSFSPDSKKIAYTALTKDNYWCVITNGVKGMKYDKVYDPKFSPDSKHLVYRAQINGKEFVVLDGKPGRQYDEIGEIVFSPNSKRIAYCAKIGNEKLCVVDNKEGKYYESYEGDDLYIPIFSPDSKSYAYLLKDKISDNFFYIVNGNEQNKYKLLGQLVFSNDSKHFSYIAKDLSSWCITIDDKIVFKNNYVLYDLTYSPDGKHMAHIIKYSDSEASVCIDGKESKHYRSVKRGSIIFSPDSKHYAFNATDTTVFKVLPNADNKESKTNYVIGNKYILVVDGEVLITTTRGRSGYYEVDMNGNSSTHQYGIDFLEPIFDSSNTLHYIYNKYGKLYTVEHNYN